MPACPPRPIFLMSPMGGSIVWAEPILSVLRSEGDLLEGKEKGGGTGENRS